MRKIKDDKVSIIIVNYNNAKYLKKSLETTINQSHKNKEIIVIDDRSKDNSLEILKKFKKKIKFYVTKNKTKDGAFNQMNCYYQGYKRSKGNYIFFLDSDDYYKKDKVKKVLNHFEKGYAKNIIFDLPIIKIKKKIFITSLFKKNLYFLIGQDLHLKVVFQLREVMQTKFLKLLQFKSIQLFGWIFGLQSCLTFTLEKSMF